MLYAANLALDLGRKWEKRDDNAIAQAKSVRANFRLCSDGAFREDGRSAAGLAIFAYDGGRRTLLYVAGQPMGILQNSFVSEVLALEHCLRTFRKL